MPGTAPTEKSVRDLLIKSRLIGLRSMSRICV